MAAVVVLFVLLVLFFAFAGFFGTFPEEWEWAGITLAAVGLVMATPAIFQMFWGRPLVKTRFDRHEQGKERFLNVYLENPPVKPGLIKRLGVRRETVQSLTVAFRISEAGSGKIIAPIRHARIYSDDDPTDTGSPRISLPPTHSVAACILVVYWDTDLNKAVVPADRLRPLLILEPGYYLASIALIVDGESEDIQRRFVVGQSADDLVWSN